MSYDITVEGGKSKRLLTAGKYCDDDIVVTATGGGVELPELTNPATAKDMAEGKQLIDGSGNVVTGELKEGNFGTASVALSDFAAGSLIQAVATSAEDKILRTGNLVTFTVASSEFGDATAADVAKGKTFTSAAGFRAVGTMEGGGGTSEEWFNDGDTHIWITLQEGRTSPMLGVCPNGTVTVDWGDGTTPDVLTGTSISTVKWTPNHEYAKPGDYVITLTVDGSVGFAGMSSINQYSYLLRYSSNSDIRNQVYQSTVQKIELGSGVTSIGNSAFSNFYSLTSIVIPDGVTSISNYAFRNCYSLASIVIPDSVKSIGTYAFNVCYSLTSIVIPDGVTSIGGYAFNGCYSLASIVIPDSVTSISTYAFSNCLSLASIVIPDSVTSIGTYAFNVCYSLTSIVIPDGVTSIGNYAFRNCYSLASIVIPGSVTSIGTNAFDGCSGIRYFDFTKHTAVPALSDANAFTNIPSDCEIRVPAALYDEWIAATNWSTYASQIVAV